MTSRVKLTFLPLICGFLAACGAAPPNVDGAHADVAAAQTVTSSSPWQTYSDPVGGFSVALPGEPRRNHEISPPPKATDYRELRITDGDPKTMDFEVNRLASSDMTALVDLGAAADIFLSKSKNAHKEERVRHGRKTVEVTGANEDGPFAVSLVAAGGWIYVLSVHASVPIDMDVAERFFDSLRLEMPWRIEAYPDVGLTLALPAPVVAMPINQPMANGATVRVYEIDWDGDLWIGVTLFPLDETRLRTTPVDQIMDDGVRALLRTKGNVIGAVTPFEHHGMHGREITHTSGDGQAFRSRMFIVGHRGYHISVSSMDPALITRETATRILDSIRIDPGQSQ